MEKFRLLRRVLKSWNREVFGDVKVKEQEILNKINVIDLKDLEGPLDVPLKGEFAKLIRKETMSWRQKAKMMWAMEGDCSASFF